MRRRIWKRRSGCRARSSRSGRGLCASRSAGRLRRMFVASGRWAGKRMGLELQIVIAMVLFLALLTAGMAVPFAIAVPAIVYLLMQGGPDALRGLGLMSW